MILASGLAELPEDNRMQGKTVLVTGATGQVGLCVVRRLLASGAAVLALSRADAIPFEHENLRWIKGDLNDKALRLNGYRAEIVVHCAPLWHTLPAMNALAEPGAKRIIVFSSTSIFAKALSKNEYEKEVVRNLSQAETELHRALPRRRHRFYHPAADADLRHRAGPECLNAGPIYSPVWFFPGLSPCIRPPSTRACRRSGDWRAAGDAQ